MENELMTHELARRARCTTAAALLLAAGCSSAEPPLVQPGTVLSLPSDAKTGDEIVATVAFTDVSGDWKDESAPGFLLELTLGGNIARHVIAPGGASSEVRVSLGAWDGGELRSIQRAGQAPLTIDVAVDPSAAGLPVMGLYDDRWWNDAPLGMYIEGDLYT